MSDTDDHLPADTYLRYGGDGLQLSVKDNWKPGSDSIQHNHRVIASGTEHEFKWCYLRHTDNRRNIFVNCKFHGQLYGPCWRHGNGRQCSEHCTSYVLDHDTIMYGTGKHLAAEFICGDCGAGIQCTAAGYRRAGSSHLQS
jgi:hypothetical protein